MPAWEDLTPNLHGGVVNWVPIHISNSHFTKTFLTHKQCTALDINMFIENIKMEPIEMFTTYATAGEVHVNYVWQSISIRCLQNALRRRL